MKKIVLFGAGKSATVLIDYLLATAAIENWQVSIADADPAAVQSKTGDSPFAMETVLKSGDLITILPAVSGG